MHHDLLAELAGYRNELAIYEDAGNTDGADAVRGEIDRVTGLIAVRADTIEARADVGAQTEVRRLRDALAPAGEDTAESAPRETATTPRRRGRRAAQTEPAPDKPPAEPAEDVTDQDQEN